MKIFFYFQLKRVMSYTCETFLKNGTYGKCFSGLDSQGNRVAFKQGYYRHIIAGFGNIKELDILARLSSSPLVPKLLNIIINKNTFMRNDEMKDENIIFVTELADTDGEIFFKNREQCTPAVSIRLASELFLAIEFLHFHKITHRDIKPANILIKFTNKGPHLKLCDFGFSTFLCNSSISTPNLFTTWYRPPEVCWCISQYGYTTDIWSIGCVIYEMFTGSILMESSNENINGENGENGETNYDLFTSILSKIPVIINQDIINLYLSNAKISMKFDRLKEPASFISVFERLQNYSSLSKTQWQQLSDILMDTFNLNYLTRKSASLCLESNLFQGEAKNISRIKDEHKKISYLDAVEIIENRIVTPIKIRAFSNFINSHKFYRIGIRTMFHALDLTNRFFNKFPNIGDNAQEVEKVVLGSIYFYNKYFATMKCPEPPEFFFEIPPKTNKITYLNEISDWIYFFEKSVVEVISNKWSIYRPGLYEMIDEYSHSLTPNQISIFFTEFLNIPSWNKKSYRYMYRVFYKKLIDPQSFPEHIK